jgi:prepilin-type N-terminal cleavage/methylation domain-containing protein
MLRRAFTLVELLVVIAIIGLLSSVAVIGLGSSRDKARIAAGQSFERSLYDASADEVLGQWDFDDCTGTGIAATSVRDYSGINNAGTPVGSPLWSSDTPTGKGRSLGLNGPSQYASTTRTITEFASGSFTVSLWVKRATIGRYDFAFSVGTASPYNYLVIGFRNTDVFTCAFYANDLNTAASYTDSNWHQWVCTYNGTTNKRSIYRDGALVASDSPASAFLGTGAPEIGRYAGTYYFSGSIDNVRIFSKALTAQGIKKMYAESAAFHQGLASR